MSDYDMSEDCEKEVIPKSVPIGYLKEEYAENQGIDTIKVKSKFKKKVNNGALSGIPDENVSKMIQLFSIHPASMRTICWYLDAESIGQIGISNISHPRLIGMMIQENIIRYLETINYRFAGEVCYDQTGEALMPVQKTTWKANNKTTQFTSGGTMLFEHAETKNRLVMTTGIDGPVANVSVLHRDRALANDIACRLETYTKKINFFRGAKLKDVNVYSASFEEVEIKENDTWDHYYYEDEVKELVELEIFGFLNNIEEYNKMGIHRRNAIIFGQPGTGKTSLGKIICRNLPNNTVLWVTPDIIRENENYKDSIKILYSFVDFVSPSIIFLEDLDLFAEDRSAVRDNIRLGALMNILDGVNSINNSVTIATTNRLDSIEGALRNRPGRFDRIVEIDKLSDELLKRMFTNRLSNNDNPIIFDDEKLEYLVRKTHDWTGAMAEEFVKTVNLLFKRDNVEKRELTDDLIDKSVSMMNRFGIAKKQKKTMGFVTEGEEE